MASITSSRPPTAAFDNIETVVRMEEQYLAERSRADRMAEGVTRFVGSGRFVLLHLLFFVAWMLVNGGLVPGVTPFDPYPFVLLTLFVSAEAVLLSTFVLITQNRMSRRADHRDHLTLQVDLLAEQEITKILQLQQLICERLGIHGAARGPEVEELSRDTAVDHLARELKDRLPDS